jgi:hypothetical protein
MEQHQEQYRQQQQPSKQSKPENVTDGIGDYIEFEEIKQDK